MTFLTGDLHGDFDDPRMLTFEHMHKDDIVICLGDFGFDWDAEHIKKFNVPCTFLFLAGNHENFSVINNLEQKPMFGSNVGVLKDGVYLLHTGQAYAIDGRTFFVFGGASSIDKWWRTPYVSWWPEEIPSNADIQKGITVLKELNYDIDFFLTHTCSPSIVKEFFDYDNPMEDPVEKMVENFQEMLKDAGTDYRHFFGHHHEYKSNGFETCLYKDIYCIDYNKTVHF